MSKNLQSMLYAGANAVLVGLAIALKDGTVPLPQSLAWLIPIAVLVITAISPYVIIGAKAPEE